MTKGGRCRTRGGHGFKGGIGTILFPRGETNLHAQEEVITFSWEKVPSKFVNNLNSKKIENWIAEIQ